MPLNKVLNWKDEAERLGVSKVARSDRGFLTYFKNNKGKLDDPHWIKTRNGFIARHLSQFKKNPTYRRLLSLYMWAFEPEVSLKM